MASVLWLKFKRMRDDVLMYVIMITMALVLTFVFANAIFGGDSTPRVYISNHDDSAVTQAFLDNLNKNAYAFEDMSEREAEIAVAKGQGLAAIVIPEGFGDGLKNAKAQLMFVKTADNADIMALENVVRAAASKTAHTYTLQNTLDDTLEPLNVEAPTLSQIEQEYASRMGNNAIVQVSMNVVGTDDYDETFAGNIHFLMGFNIFFVLFSIVFTIGSILEDKKLNTWNRIRISPLSSGAVLAGNFIPTFLVGVVQMGLVLLAGQYLFGIDLGDSLGAIFLVFVVFSLTATCLGLLLSTMLSTYEQLNAATPVILVATSMLGGCMWPLSIVGSDFLVTIANGMPQKWALEAAENLAVFGGGIGSVMANILILLGMAVLFFGASMLLYNKKQRV